jgi:hypothetical protein
MALSPLLDRQHVAAAPGYGHVHDHSLGDALTLGKRRFQRSSCVAASLGGWGAIVGKSVACTMSQRATNGSDAVRRGWYRTKSPADHDVCATDPRVG